ncbi:MAG: MOSC domain-containing protein, partial [Azoarcus sp.]|nr:MOSC domain-containing protein [Azoarcus sp.]
MSTLTLTDLYRYPVKSLRGAQHPALDIDSKGFSFDRHWMVVDAQGHFLTQRQLPKMALIDTRVDATGVLALSAPDMPYITLQGTTQQRIPVTVWKDTVEATLADPDADAWLSRFL